MDKTVIITKENRQKYKGVKGTYEIRDSEGKVVLKNKGKPWAGRTLSMGNYYGVIVGSNHYKNVRLAGTWQDGYQVHFTPSPEKEQMNPIVEE